MQHCPRRGVATGLIAFAVILGAAGNAFADTRRISDRGDVPGRLDIRSATHGHAGNRLVHTISTWGSWPVGLLGPGTPNLFALEISTDADRALERVVLVFSTSGRMVARVFRVNRRRLTFVGSARASKPNARTIRVVVPGARIGAPAGYRWNAHSQFQAPGACSRACVDKAPNTGRVLHDVTPPTIVLTSFPPLPLPLIPTDVEYDVSFRVEDAGGAGLRLWQLQHRPFGTAAWTTVASGAGAGLKSHHHVGMEGDDDQFRVIARDGSGNVRVSPVRTVSVPVDDRNPALTYSGQWALAGGDGDFLGTLSTSSDNVTPAAVDYEFSGSFVAIVAPAGIAWVNSKGSVAIDGMHMGDFFPGRIAEGNRRIVFSQGGLDPAVPHTLRIVVADSGTLPLDGIVVR